jgi:hypothetical protein
MESNRLIAEFMGMNVHHNDKSMMVRKTLQGNEVLYIDKLEYHKSWDWLMPVIEKIESLGYSFEKNYQPIDNDWQCLIKKGYDIIYQSFNDDALKSSYDVVVEFIKREG